MNGIICQFKLKNIEKAGKAEKLVSWQNCKVKETIIAFVVVFIKINVRIFKATSDKGVKTPKYI